MRAATDVGITEGRKWGVGGGGSGCTRAPGSSHSIATDRNVHMKQLKIIISRGKLGTSCFSTEFTEFYLSMSRQKGTCF